MARTTFQLHPTRQASLVFALVIMMLPFTASAIAAGRRMAAGDRAGASVPAAASLQYGQATIYRSDEAPKPVTQPEPAAPPPTAPSQPKEKVSDELDKALPVLIHGVPHRAALDYSSSVC